MMNFANEVHTGFLIVFRNIRKSRTRTLDIEREIHRRVIVDLTQPLIPKFI